MAVVNYNLPAETARCVRSVLGGTVRPAAVLLVDNGSSPEKLEAARPGLAVEVLALGRNVGFAAACNLAVNRLLGQGVEWVWLLNNDAVVEADALEVLLRTAESLPDAGIVSPLIRRLDNGRVWHRGAVQPAGLRALPRELTEPPPGEAVRVNYVTGCAMLIQRRVFELVGPFDENFFIYYEELDLCRRAEAAGFGIYLVPAATVWHEVGATGRLVPTVVRFHRARSRLRFYRLWGARPLAVPLALASTLGWVAGCLLRGDLAGALATARGAWAGLRAGLRPSYGQWTGPGNP